MPLKSLKSLHRLAFLCWLALLPAPASADPGDHRFSQGYSSGGTAIVTVSGDIAAAGTFFGSVDFGGGTLTASNFLAGDVFVARFDGEGNHLFSFMVPFTGFFGIQIEVLASDPDDNLYIAGRLLDGSVDFGGGPLSGPNQAFIAKLDPDGGHLWSATYGDATLYGLSATAAGLAITGHTTSSVDFGGGAITTPGDRDVIVARLDAQGGHIFSAGYGGNADQLGRAVAMDDVGNVYVAGGNLGSIDFGGGPLVSPTADMFLVGFTPAGAHVFSLLFPGSFSGGSSVVSVVPVLALSPGGLLGLAGEMRGSVDFGGGPIDSAGSSDAFVALYDGAGVHLRSWTGGVNTFEAAEDIAFDPNGNVMISGSMLGAADFGGGALPYAGSSDVFLAVYDVLGGHLLSRGFGTNGSDFLALNGADPEGNFVLLGGASSGIDFGGGPLADALLYFAELEGFGAPAPEMLPALGPAASLGLVALLAVAGARLLGRRDPEK